MQMKIKFCSDYHHHQSDHSLITIVWVSSTGIVKTDLTKFGFMCKYIMVGAYTEYVWLFLSWSDIPLLIGIVTVSRTELCCCRYVGLDIEPY